MAAFAGAGGRGGRRHRRIVVLRPARTPRLDRRPDSARIAGIHGGTSQTLEGLLIVRPEARLFLMNVQNVFDQIAALVAKYRPRVLALDLSRTPDLEYSA